MQNMLNELFDILGQQVRVYENILKLSKDKTEIIVAGKVAELENLVKLEQALVVQIGRLEQQREVIAGKIAAILKLDKQSLTISTLMKHLDKSQQEFLKATSRR